MPYNPIMPANHTPSIFVTTTSAVSTGGTYVHDMSNIQKASIQFHGTLGSSDTSVITLNISNDGVNFVGFSTAKTVTLTGGGTIDALFELGTIDYRYLQVSYGTPSAGTLTLVDTLYSTPNFDIDA